MRQGGWILTLCECHAGGRLPTGDRRLLTLAAPALSVRKGGRVVAHLSAIALSDVGFQASEAAHVRCLRTGGGDIHVWAANTVGERSRPEGGAVRVRHRIEMAGFEAKGRVVVAPAQEWIEADGAFKVSGLEQLLN